MKKQIIIYHESFLESVLKDSFTFFCFGAILQFNRLYLGDHWYITIFFLVLLMIWMGAKSIKNVSFSTLQDAIDYLKSKQEKS